MRIVSIVIYLFSSFLVAQSIPKIETIKIQSNELNQDREIFIYTPYYYDESPLKHYDVMFVFDAHRTEFFNLAHSIPYFLDKEEVNNEFIVIGVAATLELDDYGRNDDFLPKPIHDKLSFFYGKANQEAFINYISEEVIPYIDKNYRTLPNRLAVGHSLSASFVISTLIQKPNIFDNVIAISPNFSYDRQRLANEFIDFDFTSLESKKFFYLSIGNEFDYWKSWKPAHEKIYKFLNEEKPKNVYFNIASFPNKDHTPSFLPAFTDALSNYYKYQEKTAIEREVTFTVKVPNKNDQVFILGNHQNLGNWDEDGKLKMTKKSDLERIITIPLLPSAQIRFIGGGLGKETEAIVKEHDLSEFFYIPISPKNKTNYEFEIIGWAEE